MPQTLHCVALAVVLLCAGSVSASTELLKTNAGSLVHWTRAKITVGLASSNGSKTVASEGVAQAIRNATQAWNTIRAGQPELHFVADEPKADVIIKFCRSKWHGDTIDLGNSQFTASLHDGSVEAATIELNECDHSFTALGEAVRGSYDLQAVVTHELGHVLGLGHNDNPSAVMYPSARGVGVRTPHAEDKTTLAIIYFGRAPNPMAQKADKQETRSLPDTNRRSSRPDLEHSGHSAPRSAPGPSTDADAARVSAANTVNLVPVLSLTTSGGRQVYVYTCEPTLLPPLSSAPTSRDASRPPGHRTRSGPD